MKLEPAVKQETVRIAQGVTACCCAMFILYFLLRMVLPAGLLPLDYTVFLGGIVGGGIAVLNFFWMAVTVQQIAADPDPKHAPMRMQASFTKRMLLQGVWVILCLCLPCFFWATGVLPLFFPRVTIFILQVTGQYAPDKKGGEK